MRKLSLISAVTLISLGCMVYELSLAQLCTIMLGGVILRYSITIGLFLSGLGIGAFLIKFLNDKSSLRALLFTELNLLFIGGLSPILMTWTDFALRRFAAENIEMRLLLLQTIQYALTLIIGTLAGFELPILMNLAEELDLISSGKVLAFDYLGTVIGICVFGYVLFPNLGIVGASAAASVANSLAIVLLLWAARSKINYQAQIIISIVALLFFATVAVRSEAISEYLIQNYYLSDLK